LTFCKCKCLKTRSKKIRSQKLGDFRDHLKIDWSQKRRNYLVSP
jgi:hypothetical protein